MAPKQGASKGKEKEAGLSERPKSEGNEGQHRETLDGHAVSPKPPKAVAPKASGEDSTLRSKALDPKPEPKRQQASPSEPTPKQRSKKSTDSTGSSTRANVSDGVDDAELDLSSDSEHPRAIAMAKAIVGIGKHFQK